MFWTDLYCPILHSKGERAETRNQHGTFNDGGNFPPWEKISMQFVMIDIGLQSENYTD